MNKLSIIKVPDNFLRIKAKKIKKINKSIELLVQNMVDTLRNEEGIGLASTQVGIPLKIIVIEKILDKKSETSIMIPLTIIINPEITKFSDNYEFGEEGCLSIPNIWGKVKRSKKITVKGLDIKGKKIKIKASNLFARVLQHEIDHLNGILFTDKADINTLHQISPSGEKIKIEVPYL